jgi:hypothetical protein
MFYISLFLLLPLNKDYKVSSAIRKKADNIIVCFSLKINCLRVIVLIKLLLKCSTAYDSIRHWWIISNIVSHTLTFWSWKLCNSTLDQDIVLPDAISAKSNLITYLCWDHFHLNNNPNCTWNCHSKTRWWWCH